MSIFKGECFRGCSDLPLDNFIGCILNEDLSYLKKKKFSWVPSKKLNELWEEIFFEYMDLTKDPKHAQTLLALRDVLTLRTKKYLIEIAVSGLRLKHNDGLAAILRAQGYPRLVLDPRDRAAYAKELNLVLSRSKALNILLDEREKDLSKLKTESGKEISSSDYDALLSVLSQFQGYRLDRKIITVSEFITIMDRFKKHNEPRKNGK